MARDPVSPSQSRARVYLRPWPVLLAVLVLLPRPARRVVLSLLLLVHFAGILTAVTAVDPQGGSAPWVSRQLFARVYRPYLGFMYLSNAYHFYSPNPGPPTLLWFRIQY